MRLLFSYLKKQKKLLGLALVLAAVNQIFSLLDPQIFRLLIDNYASKYSELTQKEFLTGVLLLLAGFILVALISRIAKNFQDYYVNVITQRVGTKMYSDSVRHSLSLPFRIFEDQRSGELLRTMEKARTDSQAIIQTTINVAFFSLIGILFVLAYAFIVHWAIGLTYSLMIPIIAITTFFISRNIKKAQTEIVAETTSLAGSTTETIRNVELVKSMGLDDQEINRLNATNEKILTLELKKIKLVRTLSFIQGTLVNFLRTALMFIMLYLIFKTSISLGEFFSLLFYSFFIFNPLAEFGSLATQYQEARASNEKLADILNIKPEPKPEQIMELGEVNRINFQNVSFSYGEDEKAIHYLNLGIKKGQTVAFVGPSGAGKSTIVKLLVGLYPPTSGVLSYNDISIQSLDKDALRQRVGLVTQTTQLFAGTIRENLLFANPQATETDCLDSLHQAQIDNLPKRSLKGLDTKIGEGGIKLSGGERQRLAIARALLRDPDIIIFDEATSSLDSITETAITKTIQSLEKIKPELITILIAHRLSTVSHADTIYVLENGHIIETGNHKTLLRNNNLYAALWRQQSQER